MTELEDCQFANPQEIIGSVREDQFNKGWMETKKSPRDGTRHPQDGSNPNDR